MTPAGAANSGARNSTAATCARTAWEIREPQRLQSRFLDAYVGLNLSNWQLSYGDQSLWWRPSAAGGSLTDANVRAEFWPNSTFGFSVSTQYERWLFPVIQPNASKNVTAAIGILFQPKRFF